MPRSNAQVVKKQVQVSTFDRLMLRVKAHVNSPRAQHNHTCRVYRLDSDNDEDWERMLDDLASAEGVTVKSDDQGVEIDWRKPPADDID